MLKENNSTGRNGMARKKENEMNNKAARWEMILKLIAEKDIGTQKELADALAREGFDVTQATMSRDIRELRLLKTAKEDGTYHYHLSGKPENHQASANFYSFFNSAVVRVETAMNQVVIHTYTGMAQAVCAALDGMAWNQILGTIAGDDTILIITRDERTASELGRKLREF